MTEYGILEEQTTLAETNDGYGFAAVIHSNGHNPLHIHLYLKDSDIAVENTHTRLLIPQVCPKTLEEIQVVQGDRNLNAKQKKLILKWFNDYQDKELCLTNYGAALSIWRIFQKSKH